MDNSRETGVIIMRLAARWWACKQWAKCRTLSDVWAGGVKDGIILIAFYALHSLPSPPYQSLLILDTLHSILLPSLASSSSSSLNHVFFLPLVTHSLPPLSLSLFLSLSLLQSPSLIFLYLLTFTFMQLLFNSSSLLCNAFSPLILFLHYLPLFTFPQSPLSHIVSIPYFPLKVAIPPKFPLSFSLITSPLFHMYSPHSHFLFLKLNSLLYSSISFSTLTSFSLSFFFITSPLIRTYLYLIFLYLQSLSLSHFPSLTHLPLA